MYDIDIIYKGYKTDTDTPNNTLTIKQILQHINYPIEYHKKQFQEYDEDIVLYTIFEHIECPQHKFLDPQWKPTKDYTIIGHIVQDQCLTDRGYQDTSYCVGYTIE